jgi:hypothetical protein
LKISAAFQAGGTVGLFGDGVLLVRLFGLHRWLLPLPASPEQGIQQEAAQRYIGSQFNQYSRTRRAGRDMPMEWCWVP